MKTLNITPKTWNRVLNGSDELYSSDFEDSFRSCTPGEWIILTSKLAKNTLVGFINPLVEKGPICRVLGDVSSKTGPEKLPELWIEKKIEEAIKYRLLVGKTKNARLVFGQADGLPGLVVDSYLEAVLVQINSAGMDKYRELILECLKKFLLTDKVFTFDRESYRRNEGLPIYEKDSNLPDEIVIGDNDFLIHLETKQLQKVGYYYDHGENRLKLERYLSKLAKKPTLGLDLFCYAGTWGLHMLRGGVKEVQFVDQAAMEWVIENNLQHNNFVGRGNFIRKDVFKFLDDASRKSLKFDIIVSDPPAFSKEEKKRKSALVGYEKLHAGCLEILGNDSLFIAASCTHGISLEELDGTVTKAAKRKKRELRMLDAGIQAADHPFSSFRDNNCYIKYILYYVK